MLLPGCFRLVGGIGGGERSGGNVGDMGVSGYPKPSCTLTVMGVDGLLYGWESKLRRFAVFLSWRRWSSQALARPSLPLSEHGEERMGVC